MANRVWRLRSRPIGAIADTDLEMCQEAIPSIGEGQLLVKNLFISIDPTHRIWMSDKAQYMAPVDLNDVMRAATVGVVEASNDSAYPTGCHVVAFGGVCDYFVGIPGVNVLYPAGAIPEMPLTADLSICSVIVGLTAWVGANKILTNITPGSVVCVSGAAGAVGSIFGQLAKLKGAKVIDIAGSASKCAWMRDELGFDHVIDYKSQDVGAELKAAAPDGINAYFDNVGGDITDAVLLNAAMHSQIAVCGSISEYDDKWSGQRNWNMVLMRRITVKGFICTDHIGDSLQAAKEELAALVKKGKLKYLEDIREGLESYPSTVRLLLSGANNGKLILKV